MAQLNRRDVLALFGTGAGFGLASAVRGDLGLAAALRTKGLLRDEDINSVLTTLVNDILRVALLWTEGTWEFNQRAHLGDPVRVRIDSGSLLREAAHRLPLRFVSLRFRNPGETFMRAANTSNPPLGHVNPTCL